MSVIWTKRSLDRVIEIAEYIAEDKPTAAADWADEILSYPDTIAGLPYAGCKIPERNDDNLRQILFGAYRIIYQVEGEDVIILTVRRSSQLLDEADLGSTLSRA